MFEFYHRAGKPQRGNFQIAVSIHKVLAHFLVLNFSPCHNIYITLGIDSMGNQSLVALRHMFGLRVKGPAREKRAALAEGIFTLQVF